MSLTAGRNEVKIIKKFARLKPLAPGLVSSVFAGMIAVDSGLLVQLAAVIPLLAPKSKGEDEITPVATADTVCAS